MNKSEFTPKNTVFRPLTADEITLLTSQGCEAEDWTLLTVAENFKVDRVQQVQFQGACRLGVFDYIFTLPGGVSKPSGIYRATLKEVTVGDDTRIADVSGYIAHYDIEEECYIEHIDYLYVDEADCRFGQGTKVAVLNEAGGREVTIHEALSAQIAYLQCCYRQEAQLQEGLEEIAEAFCEGEESDRGLVGECAQITNSGFLRNIKISAFSVIEGASRLENGTLRSTEKEPAKIGREVLATDFILMPGARVDTGVSLTRCFVGEAAIIEQRFSATDSLFFANCHMACGEACALFAGPFSVSHHKSTLLIGVMTSFFNAGSGSNQSNHAYKLGPIHYGILDRGCKLGSNSYLLWPARAGLFSTIIGHHTDHFDLQSLPFSYIIEGEDNTTWVAPAACLRSAGLWRDIAKWPQRDERKSGTPTDLVDFDIFSPLVMNRVIEGKQLLQMIAKEQAYDGVDVYHFNGVSIRRSSLTNGIRLYTLYLDFFYGLTLSSYFVGGMNSSSTTYLDKELDEEEMKQLAAWHDLSGAILPQETVMNLIASINECEINSVEELNNALWLTEEQLNEFRLLHLSSILYPLHKKGASIEKPSTLSFIFDQWSESVDELFDLVLEDASKEFLPEMRVSSGIDGGGFENFTGIPYSDFTAVNGTMEEHPFVEGLQEMRQQMKKQAENTKRLVCEMGNLI